MLLIGFEKMGNSVTNELSVKRCRGVGKKP